VLVVPAGHKSRVGAALAACGVLKGCISGKSSCLVRGLYDPRSAMASVHPLGGGGVGLHAPLASHSRHGCLWTLYPYFHELGVGPGVELRSPLIWQQMFNLIS
jgi:hypothetical protein